MSAKAAIQNKILILGTTAYTAVFMDMFEAMDCLEFTACVENLDRNRCTGSIAGLPILWHEDLGTYKDTHQLTCSLGTTKRKTWIEAMAAQGFAFATLVHPSSVVSQRTSLADGVVIDAGCVIAGYSKIAGHIRIGRRVSFGHHTEIGAFSTLHPGCIVSGNCKIGSQVTVGTGAVIIDGITIGDGAIIAAGSIVTRDVPARAMVAGNPAQIKKIDVGPI